MKGTPLFIIIRTRAFVTSKDGKQNTTQVAPHYSLPSFMDLLSRLAFYMMIHYASEWIIMNHHVLMFPRARVEPSFLYE